MSDLMLVIMCGVCAWRQVSKLFGCMGFQAALDVVCHVSAQQLYVCVLRVYATLPLWAGLCSMFAVCATCSVAARFSHETVFVKEGVV
jgi:hypothetical protein